MKLYILKPVEGLPENRKDNPWEPWYDKVFGFVIRAKSPTSAREIADDFAGNENDSNLHPWLHPKYSTCKEIPQNEEEEMILRDFCAA